MTGSIREAMIDLLVAGRKRLETKRETQCQHTENMRALSQVADTGAAVNRTLLKRLLDMRVTMAALQLEYEGVRVQNKELRETNEALRLELQEALRVIQSQKG